ncbi:hypothetical protein DFP72DRAFT_451840 [Ephemerocybe angulata]|uniref:Tyrosinase copper-binding domain-containing protein n=1 Tax=Ephemerocybe angulata TaxID=980116 RepID=A0A8H6HV53_9AGAR|nr:hypothetical protein DFP72DRAFT_451840 [Tulosesus angulatus]
MSSLSPSLASPRTPSGLGCATLRPSASSPAKSPSFTPDGPAFSDDIAFDPQSRPTTELEDWPSNGAPDGVGPDDPRRQDSSTRPKISPHRGAVTSTGRGHGPGSQYQHPVTRESREVLTPRPSQSATDKGAVASAPHGVGKGKKVAPEAPALVKAGSETDPAPRKEGLDAQHSPPAAQTNPGKRRYDEPHLARPRPANPGKENREPTLGPASSSEKTRSIPDQAKGVNGDSKGSPGTTPVPTPDSPTKNRSVQRGSKLTKDKSSTVPLPSEVGGTPVSVQASSSRLDSTSRGEASRTTPQPSSHLTGQEVCGYVDSVRGKCTLPFDPAFLAEHRIMDHIKVRDISHEGYVNECGMGEVPCEVKMVHMFDLKFHLSQSPHHYKQVNTKWKMPCGEFVEGTLGVVGHASDPTQGCENKLCSSILDQELKTRLHEATEEKGVYMKALRKLMLSTWRLNVVRDLERDQSLQLCFYTCPSDS